MYDFCYLHIRQFLDILYNTCDLGGSICEHTGQCSPQSIFWRRCSPYVATVLNPLVLAEILHHLECICPSMSQGLSHEQEDHASPLSPVRCGQNVISMIQYKSVLINRLCLMSRSQRATSHVFDWMKHLFQEIFAESCEYESSLFRALGQGCLVLLQFVFGRSLFVDLFLNLNDAASASFILSCGDLIGIKLQFNKSDFAKMSPIQNTALRTLTVGLKPQVQ